MFAVGVRCLLLRVSGLLKIEGTFLVAMEILTLSLGSVYSILFGTINTVKSLVDPFSVMNRGIGGGLSS